MNDNMTNTDQAHVKSGGALNRRQFLGGALTLTASASSLASLSVRAAESPPTEPKAAGFQRKIKLGVIGNGGRGAWIAGLFQKHGGYKIHAVADYFQEVADRCGDALGVDKTRRFSTLSGYKKLIESGVEAVALETPPCFFPQHARAAVEAGLHVYMAKPAKRRLKRTGVFWWITRCRQIPTTSRSPKWFAPARSASPLWSRAGTLAAAGRTRPRPPQLRAGSKASSGAMTLRLAPVTMSTPAFTRSTPCSGSWAAVP